MALWAVRAQGGERTFGVGGETRGGNRSCLGPDRTVLRNQYKHTRAGNGARVRGRRTRDGTAIGERAAAGAVEVCLPGTRPPMITVASPPPVQPGGYRSGTVVYSTTVAYSRTVYECPSGASLA